MKTIEELYKSILADGVLKAQCIEAIKANKLDEFLKAQDCNATVEDVKAFIKSKKEVSPDELDTNAGGCNADEAVLSAVSFGLYCAYAGIASAITKRSQDWDFGPGSILCKK